jgi:hypothetical protein
MIANHLFAIWTNVAAALGNHLWQSTLCLVVAGLLAQVLRKNPARIRHAVWLAASVKLILPWSPVDPSGRANYGGSSARKQPQNDSVPLRLHIEEQP